MDKWFDDKLERERLRSYTRKRIKGENPINNFLRKLSITNWFIVFIILVFILVYLLAIIFGEEKIFSLFALTPKLFFLGKVWTVFTSMFIHAGFVHLFVNMFSLFFIGNFVERIIGRKRFFWFYIISGIIAGSFFALLSFYLGNFCNVKILGACLGSRIFGNPEIPAVGASGAIFALVGLLAVLTPKNRVYLIVGPLIAIILETILSAFLKSITLISVLNSIITLYIIFSVFAMISFNPSVRKLSLPVEMPFWVLPIIAIIPLIIIGLFFDLPIGNMAHLGGLLAGLVFAIYLKKKYKKKTDMINRIFSK